MRKDDDSGRVTSRGPVMPNGASPPSACRWDGRSIAATAGVDHRRMRRLGESSRVAGVLPWSPVIRVGGPGGVVEQRVDMRDAVLAA